MSLSQYAAVDAADDLARSGRDDKAYARRGAIAAASVKALSYLFPLDVTQLQTQLQTEALAGTPEQLRSELDSRGLRDVQIHAPEPGASFTR